jgi:predicted AAA+ superfamily ATPase
MNEKTLIDLLSLTNTWWTNERNFPLGKTYEIKRTDFHHIWRNHLLETEGLLISGPRGVGKSTVMFEIMKRLLGIDSSDSFSPTFEKVDKERILYISFEDPALKKFSLQEILMIYSKYILKQDINKIPKKVFVFFDEIQNIENWGDQVKSIIDKEYNLKFFITGSSSVALLNEASKAARRIKVYSMHPLKFFDFMRFKLKNPEFDKILANILGTRKKFLEAYKVRDTKKVYESFIALYASLKGWQTNLEIGFQEYLVKGGYPKYVNEDDYQKISSSLNETFRLGFHKDLVLGGGIGDPKAMETLTTYIASISSSETSYNSLIQNTNSAKNSYHMRRYLYHLETSYLVKDSQKFSPVTKKSFRGFKIYLNDIAIRNMLQGYLNKLLETDRSQYGLNLETAIFDHALRLFYKIRGNYPMQYWKGSRNQEVDIVLQLDGIGIPLEVKSSDEPSYNDLSGLKAFCKKYNVPGIVVCGKKLDLKENIIFVPHWLFTLIC